MSSTTLPATMKALMVDSPSQPLQLKTVPTPSATPGSCIVKILAVEADANTPHILKGVPGYTFPANFVPAAHAIGRVVTTGPDATVLRPGQLVMLEGFIRPRDDPNEEQILWGLTAGLTPQSLRFMADNWAWGCMAEYARAPLENVYPLDEARLCGSPAEGGLGYAVENLLHLPTLLVAMGGLRAIDVKPGERVIVAPATGGFSGAAVQVALAIGAQVVAVGRSRESLLKLQGLFPPGRVQIVQVTGDVEKDTVSLKQFGPVDAYVDLSPPEASNSTHLRSCFAALRKYGRACVMNIIGQDVAVQYPLLTWNSLTVRGQFMYEREDARLMIKMAEAGVLRLGEDGGNEVVGRFKLEDVNEAFALAAKNHGVGKLVALVP
ncbi:GroES-like protein [Parathielavia appendiculata]|uniref:GroES-like protein n=1 Tax=Parathielavia appendiculata TaxID=2587402 RepID=A0AAN6TUG6_9PEZI|nr:GroES-like protein [Parathielavia appendiculata]